MGRAGLSNGGGGGGGGGFSSGGNYGRFSEDFLNQHFHFHNPFDIFEQFMRASGMDDDFGKSIIISSHICENISHRMSSTRFASRLFSLDH